MVFRAKVGPAMRALELVFWLGVVGFLVGWRYMGHFGLGIAAAVFALLGLICSLLGSGTYYVLEPEGLKVVSLCFKKTVPYGHIVDIADSRDAQAAPAPSLDRVKIRYKTAAGGPASVLVSPKDKRRFKKELYSRCFGGKISES